MVEPARPSPQVVEQENEQSLQRMGQYVHRKLIAVTVLKKGQIE